MYYEEEPHYEPSIADEIMMEYQEKMKDALLNSIKYELKQIKEENTNLKNQNEEYKNNFVIRQLTVINCIQGDVLFQMTGKMSIKADIMDNQLEVTVQDENGLYQKHFIGLSDNVTYVVEQKQYENVSNYRYTLNYNPKMWLPVDVKTID